MCVAVSVLRFDYGVSILGILSSHYVSDLISVQRVGFRDFALPLLCEVFVLLMLLRLLTLFVLGGAVGPWLFLQNSGDTSEGS